MSRRTLVGNWKMHGDSRSLPAIGAIAAQVQVTRTVDVVLCLPATLIHRAAAQYPNLCIGGQDCHYATHGAHTGEVSAAMVNDAGARFVILGHSERRQCGETDSVIAAKASAAQAAGLRVILCVGETIEERRANRAAAAVAAQLHRSLEGFQGADLLIAYEPVWAIGSGLVPTPQDVADMAGHIGEHRPGAKILYGGSVTPTVGASLIAHVDGFLVGGASLSPTDFGALIRTLDTVSTADTTDRMSEV